MVHVIYTYICQSNFSWYVLVIAIYVHVVSMIRLFECKAAHENKLILSVQQNIVRYYIVKHCLLSQQLSFIMIVDDSVTTIMSSHVMQVLVFYFL